MRILLLAALLTLVTVPALAAEPKTDDQKTLYAIGLVISRQLAVLNLAPEELDLVKQGITDGVTGKTPLVDMNAYASKIQNLAVTRRNAEGERLAAKAPEYLAQAAKEKGAVKTESGLIYVPLKEGAGVQPKSTDKVKVHYRGTLIDGKEFDSSYLAGQPAEFQLDKVIKCWTEGVVMMKVGGKAKLVCPPQLAYGERGSGSIPSNATLVFNVELIDIVKSAPAASPK